MAILARLTRAQRHTTLTDPRTQAWACTECGAISRIESAGTYAGARPFQRIHRRAANLGMDEMGAKNPTLTQSIYF